MRCGEKDQRTNEFGLHLHAVPAGTGMKTFSACVMPRGRGFLWIGGYFLG